MESVQSNTQESKRLGWFQILAIVLIAMVITSAATLWLAKAYLFPSEFTPVALNEQEKSVLSAKLESLDKPLAAVPAAADSGAPLKPEAYSEAGATRDIHFSERELNSLLAKNTDLAKRVAVDLSDNLISARILIPMDEDFPLLGGKTLRARTGIEFSYENERPVVKLKGVTIMGVPIPNAWLGGLKNIDLVQEFGSADGFWKAFSDGVAAVKVEEGALRLRLHE
ncbi:MAG: arginine N-succinyltransferase [Chromatiaceae bacterium]|nr:arginine N-succinyltransferase [Gammaproteobacteria bacterium]MCP5426889.1 arginine N-succinyltransferase [Chromatiaceae bacterium]MCB1871453.1 arginine N-succinyltransferase [Gammaproteobacteria bacterium]MCB1880192.1 arginine N-succinyltransferase [Gammaproteobacteria bacterium]MCB1903719.1 arginine N-succinyltransferase [Gammaproteobacteria bacterium]